MRLARAQFARASLIESLAALVALGVSSGEAAEAARWLETELAGLPAVRRRRRDAAILALRREGHALVSDNRAAGEIAASLARFAARRWRLPPQPDELPLDRLRREALAAGNGKAPGKHTVRAILASNKV